MGAMLSTHIITEIEAGPVCPDMHHCPQMNTHPGRQYIVIRLITWGGWEEEGDSTAKPMN
ncbi:hypothetical protein BHE74_00010051 [Ensete ventricosum]|nr:hypothetical protein GW17_00024961 [Ensete ventricosum]RWW81534.1 hypothetical protein BHE74_00010051 [Ensete ventricosum]RZR96526.1 hypothetical protein BHM03_00025563 [Ensete ventricosum]